MVDEPGYNSAQPPRKRQAKVYVKVRKVDDSLGVCLNLARSRNEVKLHDLTNLLCDILQAVAAAYRQEDHKSERCEASRNCKVRA
jgi:hypothetical protein